MMHLHSNTMITAHSGCEGTKTNSMEQIEKVLQLSIPSTEVDIRLVENTLVLSHDDIVTIAEDTFTLKQLFERIKDTELYINCDLKHSSLVEPICKLASLYKLEHRLFFTGATSSHDLLYVKDSLVFANIEGYYRELDNEDDLIRIMKEKTYLPLLADTLTIIKSQGFHGVNAYYKVVNSDFVDICQRLGLKVISWTVDHDEDFKKLIQLDLFAITTNKPINGIKWSNTLK